MFQTKFGWWRALWHRDIIVAIFRLFLWRGSFRHDDVIIFAVMLSGEPWNNMNGDPEPDPSSASLSTSCGRRAEETKVSHKAETHCQQHTSLNIRQARRRYTVGIHDWIIVNTTLRMTGKTILLE